MPSIGRRLNDTAQWARGRGREQYELEVIPLHVAELPPSQGRQVSFAWERGTKLFVSDAVTVNPTTNAAFFRQWMTQTTTIYFEHGVVVPKEYYFKVQTVTQSSKGQEDRKTIARVKVDMAQYCRGEVNPAPEDVHLTMQPSGRAKVTIRARCLKDARADEDTQTEVTELTETSATLTKPHKSKGKRDVSAADEQDLSGFEAVPFSDTEKDAQGSEQQHAGQQPSSRLKSPRSRLAQPGGDQAEQQQQQEQLQDPEDPGGANIPRKGTRHKTRNSQASDPTQEATSLAPAHQEEYLEEGTQLHRFSWRDLVCCCCGPRSTAGDGQEQAALLSGSKQASAMGLQNDTSIPSEQKKRRRKKKRRPRPESIPEQDEEHPPE